MTTVTAPLKTITLAALVPDVVRSCVVLQPSPPPDPGEEPPAPVAGPGIYTPIAPGVIYANLPVAPTIVDTSPDQMIGCIITVADNPQGRLNALFSSAVDGDGVIDRATNDIWVYDGATWNNVGPTPGPTITATTVIPPWNETLLAVARTRTKLSVNALAYALELLTEPDPIVTATALLVRSAQAFIRIPYTDFTFTVHLPTVTGGASVQVSISSFIFEFDAPAISSGSSINAPIASIEVTAQDAQYAGKRRTPIFLPLLNTDLATYMPTIAAGKSISINTVNIELVASAPRVYDADAYAYIQAVEAADTQSLEDGIKEAINTFVVGCRSDGIWDAIKASCILAGARTLTGALVPLTGAAPTNVNFVAGDYNRETGLLGDGSTKYLNSNRNISADPQNNAHISAYGTTWGATTSSTKAVMGRQIAGFNERAMLVATSLNSGNLSARVQSRDSWASHGTPRAAGFIGAARSSPSSINIRNNGTTVSVNQSSATPSAFSLFVFATSNGTLSNDPGSPTGYDNSRISFYSIGESLDLSLLDARVTQLMSDIAAAIP